MDMRSLERDRKAWHESDIPLKPGPWFGPGNQNRRNSLNSPAAKFFPLFNPFQMILLAYEQYDSGPCPQANDAEKNESQGYRQTHEHGLFPFDDKWISFHEMFLEFLHQIKGHQVRSLWTYLMDDECVPQWQVVAFASARSGALRNPAVLDTCAAILVNCMA